MKSKLASYPNLIILRAYTKMFAVPGVRFGWCMTANATLLDALYRAGQPWNVSVVAQACAVAAAGESGWAAWTALRIAEERAFLADGLRSCGLAAKKRNYDTKLRKLPRTCAGILPNSGQNEGKQRTAAARNSRIRSRAGCPTGMLTEEKVWLK